MRVYIFNLCHDQYDVAFRFNFRYDYRLRQRHVDGIGLGGNTAGTSGSW